MTKPQFSPVEFVYLSGSKRAARLWRCLPNSPPVMHLCRIEDKKNGFSRGTTTLHTSRSMVMFKKTEDILIISIKYSTSDAHTDDTQHFQQFSKSLVWSRWTHGAKTCPPWVRLLLTSCILLNQRLALAMDSSTMLDDVGRLSWFWELEILESGDSGMYPYQRTPMGNPYISPIYIVGIYGL